MGMSVVLSVVLGKIAFLGSFHFTEERAAASVLESVE